MLEKDVSPFVFEVTFVFVLYLPLHFVVVLGVVYLVLFHNWRSRVDASKRMSPHHKCQRERTPFRQISMAPSIRSSLWANTCQRLRKETSATAVHSSIRDPSITFLSTWNSCSSSEASMCVSSRLADCRTRRWQKCDVGREVMMVGLKCHQCGERTNCYNLWFISRALLFYWNSLRSTTRRWSIALMHHSFAFIRAFCTRHHLKTELKYFWHKKERLSLFVIYHSSFQVGSFCKWWKIRTPSKHLPMQSKKTSDEPLAKKALAAFAERKNIRLHRNVGSSNCSSGKRSRKLDTQKTNKCLDLIKLSRIVNEMKSLFS